MAEEKPVCRQIDVEPEPATEEATPALTREAILAVDDRKLERFEVPEWGGVIYLRVMTGTERDAWEQGIGRGAGQEVDGLMAIALLVAKVVADADGNRLFSDDDVELLKGKSAPALMRVWARAQRLNALTDGDVEALVKNSSGDLTDDSGSG